MESKRILRTTGCCGRSMSMKREGGKMELKKVLLALGAKRDAQADLLKERLSSQGVCCNRLYIGRVETRENRDSIAEKLINVDSADVELINEKSINGESTNEKSVGEKLTNLESINAADTVVITDDRGLAAALAGRGVVCIGCDEGEGSFFEGAALVTDAIESLDAGVLEEYLLRGTGRPVTIAVTDRLIVREIAEQDLPNLYRIDRRFLPEKMEAYIRCAYRFFGYGLWSVLLHDGTLIGCCGFAEYSDDAGRARDSGRAKDSGSAKDSSRAKDSGSAKDSGHAKDWIGTDSRGPVNLCRRAEPAEQNGEASVRLELQYIVADGFRRRGYAEEMCRASLAYAYGHLHAGEVWVRIEESNQVSRKLAEKLGFV